MEDQFLRSAPSCKGGNLIQRLLLAHEIPLPLLHLHGITQGAGGPWYDGNLLHGRGLGLAGSHQGMPHLVVCHDFTLFLGNDRVFLLISRDDGLHAFFQIPLDNRAAAHAYGPQRRLIDDIGQFCAAGPCRGPGNGAVIHVIGHLDISSVYP